MSSYQSAKAARIERTSGPCADEYEWAVAPPTLAGTRIVSLTCGGAF
jgi:hypothetical protein